MNELKSNDDGRMRAVMARDAAAGVLYGVRSTRIVCRSGCASRTPRVNNVVFFDDVVSARKAGYRPCKRCRPDQPDAASPHVELMKAAARRIELADTPLSLAELAAGAHLSPFHFQRAFKSVIGVSPKQYQLALRSARLKHTLRQESTVLRATVESGASPGGLGDPSKNGLGMTPSRFKAGAVTERILYALAETWLGMLVIARTGKGVCAIRLGDSADALVNELRNEFLYAEFVLDGESTRHDLDVILAYLSQSLPHPELPTDIRATAFQRKVWQALREIPPGQTRSYAQVAAAIGKPTATRAVANACAANPLAMVVPCHRVVRADGAAGGYRWGMARKAQLLALEKVAT